MSTGNAFNAIWIGYSFSQDFVVEADDFPEEVVLWLDLRKSTPPKDVLVDAVELARVNTTTFRLELTAEQTALLAVGLVEGDFIQRLEAIDTPLGLRLQIPVLAAASEPRP